MIKINHSVAEDSSANIEVNRTEPYVIFMINNEEFGIEAKKVLELVKYLPPLAMPNNYLNSCGMSVFHGKIVPIVDMRMIFGLEPIVYDHHTVIILVESSTTNFGIIAEQILDINHFPINSIKTINCYNLGEKTQYLKNVANIDGRLTLLLDLEKLIVQKQEQAAPVEPIAPQNTARFEISGASLEEASEISGEIISEKPPSEPLENSDYTNLETMPLLAEAQNEPITDAKTGSFQPEKNQNEHQEPSNYLIDPQELEALFPECHSQVNNSSLNPEKNNGEIIDQIMNTEQVAEILSDLEAELASVLPENTETTPTMGNEPQLTQQGLSEEAIEDILRQLEAEARLKIEETSPDSNNRILEIENRETTGENYHD
jgi:purine-binding chemotaxis protein CheW